MIEIIVALIGAAGIITVGVLNIFSAKKTRKQGTLEHQQAMEAREENTRAVMMAIGVVHDEVKAVNAQLWNHGQDPWAHKRSA